MASIDVDWSVDSEATNEDVVLEDVKSVLQGLGVKASVVTLRGPGGGAPVVRLKGSVEALRRAFKAYDPDADEEDFALYGL